MSAHAVLPAVIVALQLGYMFVPPALFPWLAGSAVLSVAIRLVTARRRARTSPYTVPVGGRTLVASALSWSLVPACLAAMHTSSHGGFDIAIFAQTLRNVATTGVPWASVGVYGNHLGTHFEPVLFPLGWLSALTWPAIPNYLLLYAAQALLASVAIVVAAIPSPRAPSNHAGLLLVFLVTAFWGSTGAQLFEFHPVTLGGSLALAAMAAHLGGRQMLAYALAAIAVTCGEMFLVSQPVMIATFALVNCKVRGARAWPLQCATVVAGAMLLALYLKVAAPAWSTTKGEFWGLARYSGLGSSFGEIAMAPLRDPGLVFRTLTTPDKLVFFAALLLLPLAALPFLKWTKSDESEARDAGLLAFGALLAGAAPLAKIFLATNGDYTTFGKHYVADVVPALALALAALVRAPRVTIVLRPLALMLAPALLSLPFPLNGDRTIATFAARATILPHATRAALTALPQDAAIYTNNLQLAHLLADRYALYSDHTPQSAIAAAPPQYLVLGWPATHGITTPDASLFGRSFALAADLSAPIVETHWQHGSHRYRFVQELPAAAPGSVWLYERLAP